MCHIQRYNSKKVCCVMNTTTQPLTRVIDAQNCVYKRPQGPQKLSFSQVSANFFSSIISNGICRRNLPAPCSADPTASWEQFAFQDKENEAATICCRCYITSWPHGLWFVLVFRTLTSFYFFGFGHCGELFGFTC